MPNLRHLILLRHAHAEPQAPGMSDLDRPLSATGKLQASAGAAWLKEHLAHAPRIICSPSVRTKATAQAVAAHWSGCNVHEVADIYEASAGTLMDVLDRDHHSPVILVGHNPGLEAALALLSTGQSSAARGMSPGAIAWLTAPKNALVPGCAELKLFWPNQ